MRVGVFGAGGRMGSTVCRAVADDPELELVAAVDPRLAGIDINQVAGVQGSNVQVEADAEVLLRAETQVAVDFTEVGAARQNLRWCAANGVHAVVGTTGFTRDDVMELDRLFSGKSNCVLSANFAIGAALMTHFAELAAPYMDTAEIVELHHDAKLDAPSGTSLRIAEGMSKSRETSGSGGWGEDPTKTEVVKGSRGASGPGGIRMHSVRLRGLVAHHEVILGAAGQTLTIRHDSYDRTSFMPGVLLAVKSVADRPGLTLGLDSVLGLG
ncbi:MAG TPA: 4-hydroxy-tetrahydrodipicolinate reductase [Acidimicrobiales bacterium]|nr:4-hydroxy-tetrahydrodipicolinate reductase [Acidimicrobiales bacterium]